MTNLAGWLADRPAEEVARGEARGPLPTAVKRLRAFLADNRPEPRATSGA